MRIAIVYDLIAPHTVGGAERWCRALADRLAHDHEVTYVTRRVWGEAGPGTDFATVAVAPGGALYTRSGRRRIWPPIRFGIGVFWHLLRNGRRYEVVHCTAFPYFSLLGAWLGLRLSRSRGRLVADWHEVWGRDYWISYLGPVGGRLGHLVQRLCIRAPEHSFTFSRMHAERLAAEGHRAPITRLTGEYEEPPNRPAIDLDGRSPLVVFAGRHIPEKRVPAIPPAIARARRAVPGLRCLILGDGPETDRVRERVRELGLDSAVEVRGRVEHGEVIVALAGASCLLLPSEREGYGLVVVEGVSLGTPAVVVAGPENAATELIEPGVNGVIAPSAESEPLAEAIVQVLEGDEPMRRSTAEWYRRHARELSIESSLEAVERAYAPPGDGRSA